MDTGLLIIRLFFGLAMAGHGAQKLFGWFGGYGLKATGGFFDTIGFRPGIPFAFAAGMSEFAGGLLLAVGLWTPAGAAAVLSAMIVAMVSVHLKHGFFAAGNGIEMAFLYAAAALGVGLTGPGALSLDALLGLRFLSEPRVVTGFLVAAVVGATVTLTVRGRTVSALSKS